MQTAVLMGMLVREGLTLEAIVGKLSSSFSRTKCYKIPMARMTLFARLLRPSKHHDEWRFGDRV